ncbi:ribonuclease E inhibitor RraB, partial [Burkholderia sp. GbtcB21]|uniref:ribonuclease E inhibitor RraB n=1 Tax=Burkholderia sp. GbtcB21 TaxID=2824766 RepID=UPI001C2F93C8
HQDDPDKEAYWQTLYPTDVDWQIMRDMRVLDALRQKGDAGDVNRRVMHWAYFPDPSDVHQFADWAEAKGYPVETVAPTEDGTWAVRFWDEGTMALADITRHTIAINREVRSLGG